MNVHLRVAKEKKQYLYAPSASGTATPTGTRANGAAAHGEKRSFEGHVIRVWSGDQISILDKETNKERRVQLSSTRALRSVNNFSMTRLTIVNQLDRATDPKQAYWAAEAKEVGIFKLLLNLGTNCYSSFFGGRSSARMFGLTSILSAQRKANLTNGNA
jgi:hypothetical protein